MRPIQEAMNAIIGQLLLLLLFLLHGHQTQGTNYLNLLNSANIVNTLRNVYGSGNGNGNGYTGTNTFGNGNGGYSYNYPMNGNSFNPANGGPNSYVATISPPTLVYNNNNGGSIGGPPTIHRTRPSRNRDGNNYEYEYFWEYGPDGKKRERITVRGQPPNGFVQPGGAGPATNQPGNLPPGHRFNRPPGGHWNRGHRRPNRPNWVEGPTTILNGNQPIIINSPLGQPSIQPQPVQPQPVQPQPLRPQPMRPQPVQPVYGSTQTPPTPPVAGYDVSRRPQRPPNRVVAGTPSPSPLSVGAEDYVDSAEPEVSFPTPTASPAYQGPLERAAKVCGLTYNTRIVGGKEADPNQWIWMAALIRKNGTNYCGGALITDQHILTAAHCLKGTTPREMFVRLGAYDFTDDASATGEDHEIEHFNIHPQYDRYTHKNDIAVLKMKNKAQFTHFIRPVCLPPKRRSYVNELATVVGWGTTDFGAPSSNKLREVTIPIWKNENCSEAYKQNITANNLCAGFKEGGKDSCQGDSGGPLMLPGVKNKWTIVGIVSWGIRCGEPGYPGVYTRVNRYLDWLQGNV